MPKWIRVRDTQSGHTFDVEARSLEHRRGVEPVLDPERWPDIEGPRVHPRPAKPFVGKDGGAATPARFAVAEPHEGGEAFIPRSDGQIADAENSPGQDTQTDGGRTRRTKTTSDPAGPSADTTAPKE